MKTQTEKNWAIAMHLSPFAGALIPLAGIFAPIVIWLTKRSQSQFLNEQGKEAVNFMICEGIAGIMLLLLGIIVSVRLDHSGPIEGLCLFSCLILTCLPVAAYGIIMPVIAAVKCSSGENFRYPHFLRFVK